MGKYQHVYMTLGMTQQREEFVVQERDKRFSGAELGSRAAGGLAWDPLAIWRSLGTLFRIMSLNS